MAASNSVLASLHEALAKQLLKMFEEGILVASATENEPAIYRAPSAAEMGVAVSFLKNNSITADIEENDALKKLRDELNQVAKPTRPVTMPDPLDMH